MLEHAEIVSLPKKYFEFVFKIFQMQLSRIIAHVEIGCDIECMHMSSLTCISNSMKAQLIQSLTYLYGRRNLEWCFLYSGEF